MSVLDVEEGMMPFAVRSWSSECDDHTPSTLYQRISCREVILMDVYCADMTRCGRWIW